MSDNGELCVPSNVPRRIDQIVELAAQGYTDKEISQLLGMSNHTVRTHWQRLREKLGVKNRTTAVLAYLQKTVEQQSQELQAINEALHKEHALSWEGMVALLADTQKRLAEALIRDHEQQYHLDYFERASHLAKASVYELKSISPVEYAYFSASATTLRLDAPKLKQGQCTFYDVVYPEDLPLLYKKSLGATYLPHERYVFIYRLQTAEEPRWVLDTHQAVYDEGGNSTGVLGVVRDIHDLVVAGLIPPEVARLVISAEPVPSHKTATLLEVPHPGQ